MTRLSPVFLLLPRGRAVLRLLAPAFALALAFAPPAPAQTAPMPNLADLRADLDAVAADLQSLRAALRVSGAAGYASAGGPDAIARMDRMEATLRQLTGAVEEARNRIEELAADSAQRLDDAEFRLCQLEVDCDLGALTSGEGWGGELTDAAIAPPAGAAAEPAPASAAEQAAFEAAVAQARQGDPKAAAAAFAAFARNHAGGPLFTEARFLEGQALLAAGETRAASRALTDVFAADPDGPRAPAALLAIAQIMEAEGQPAPACQFLSELTLRHPGTPEAGQAAPLYDRLSCDDAPDLDP